MFTFYSQSHLSEQVMALNGYILDISNALCIKAFTTSKAPSLISLNLPFTIIINFSLQSDLSKQVIALNGYILDISNALWRHKAFTASKAPSVFNTLTAEVVSAAEVNQANGSFSLHHHLALVGYARRFLIEVCHDGSFCFWVSISKLAAPIQQKLNRLHAHSWSAPVIAALPVCLFV